MNILLADDNSEVRSALRFLLEHELAKVNIAEVCDIQELFERLTEVCPEFILVDWELPGLFENGNMMKLHSLCEGLKVIALSSQFEARQKALQAGVDAFISKGEPPEKIIPTLLMLIPEDGQNGA